MSCSNATAPITISKNIDSICNLKCAYSFTYPISTLKITTQRNYIAWNIDDTNSPPVVYNDQNYNVQEARLYHPSLHNYGSGKADAELVIVHTDTRSTKNLLVCIPYISSSTSTDDTVNFLDIIMTEVSNTANSVGQQTVFNNHSFSLGKFVPMKPYYSYTGTLPWTPCNGIYDYVVFHKDNAKTISPRALATLKTITSAHKYAISTTNTGGLFLNANGPVPPERGEIYIDCQPTGDDGEILVPFKPAQSGSLLNNALIQMLINSIAIKVIFGAILMYIIWKVANKILTSLVLHMKPHLNTATAT